MAVNQALKASKNNIINVTINTNGKAPQRVINFTETAESENEDITPSTHRLPKPLFFVLGLFLTSIALFSLWLIFSIKWWY